MMLAWSAVLLSLCPVLFRVSLLAAACKVDFISPSLWRRDLLLRFVCPVLRSKLLVFEFGFDETRLAFSAMHGTRRLSFERPGFYSNRRVDAVRNPHWRS